MEKLNFETPDGTVANIAKLAELFPAAVAEGKVNFDLFRTLLGDEVFGDEAYEFTWVGKRAAIAEAGRPIRKTLRPCVEESKNWDTTENLYIEGDNLDVLKLLQESYLGKVKMIYIDPPYNTGNDFVYKDNFAQSKDDYGEEIGLYDDDGDKLFRNTESNGRFHSDWCSMIYPRLVLARNLLSNDGVIFISIDDNEVENLKKICNEVFGEAYFFGCYIWHRRQMADSRNQTRSSTDHEYVLTYARPDHIFKGNEIDKSKYANPDNDPRGMWFSADLTGLANKEQRPNLHYNVTDPATGLIYPPNPTRGWSCSHETMRRLIDENRILWPSKPDGRPRLKKFLSEITDSKMSFSTMLNVGFTTEGTRVLQELFENKLFSYPKPVSLIKTFVEQATRSEDIILDFFAGSSTTAQAVFEQNAQDNEDRHFILVQIPEAIESGEYKNICEIGKERIRRAGEKIKKENPLTAKDLDNGFRVLKLDDTNMKDVYYSAAEYTQDLIALMESNIKDDRTDMDLLFGCLIDWGLPLSFPHTHEVIDGATVHTYSDEGDRIALIACFSENISDNVVKEIAKRKPLRAVFRDSSFSSSPEKINVAEIFKLLAPDTSVKVI